MKMIRNRAHYDTISEGTTKVFKVIQKHIYEVLTQRDGADKWLQREHETTLLAVVHDDDDIVSVQIDGSNLEVFSQDQLEGYITLLNAVKDSGVLRDEADVD